SFSNDPATPDIYTLSLHDALPILGHLLARQSMFISMLLGGRVVYIYTGKDITAAHAQPREQGLNDTHFDAFLKHSRAAQSIEVRDRKSTRLNSSHVSISYAVFCLK